MFLTKRKKITKHKKTTCVRLACGTIPAKKYFYRRHRTGLTIKGNLIECKGCTSTATAEMTTIKMMWNHVVSTPGAKCITIDIKDMCLADNKEIDEFECFQMSMSYFLQQLIDACDLLDYMDAK